MGRRKMTEEQKLEKEMEEYCQGYLRWMADSLAVYKNRKKMTKLETASDLNIGCKAVSMILAEEPVELSSKDLFRLMFIFEKVTGQKKEVTQ